MCIKRSTPLRQAGHALCGQLKTLQVNSVVTAQMHASIRVLVERYLSEENKIMHLWMAKAKRKNLRKRSKKRHQDFKEAK